LNTGNHPFDSADTASRLGALEAVYRLYDEFAAGLALFCHRDCAHCCTANVTVTSLEARFLLDFFTRTNQSALLQRRIGEGESGFRPVTMTTNALARLCAEGKTPPEEPREPPPGRCPLLTEEICPVYAARPFACRCLVSKTDCGDTGYAAVDDFTLSLNTVFLQCIEHLDAGGFSGNLAVMLSCLNPVRHQGTVSPADLPPALAANSPLTILMVPPQHREAMAPWLGKLRQAMVLRHPPNIARQVT
jgi:hypothetical protein